MTYLAHVIDRRKWLFYLLFTELAAFKLYKIPTQQKQQWQWQK